jgi:hypothetical protein
MFCEICDGAGKIVTYTQIARPPYDWVDCPDEIITCPACKGRGYGRSGPRDHGMNVLSSANTGAWNSLTKEK